LKQDIGRNKKFKKHIEEAKILARVNGRLDPFFITKKKKNFKGNTTKKKAQPQH